MILSNWKMSYGEHKDLACTAPCSMYSVLLEHGIIDDPYYGLNELDSTHLSENDCVFESEFILDDDFLRRDFLELELLGIDTICRIVVNGITVANVQNMHRRYIYDIKNIVKKGINTVRLEISSPIRYFKEMNNKHFLYMNNDTLKGAGHLRKAFYMSGWDWGPILPDMGIFRPICLEAYDHDKIDNIFVLQKHENGVVSLDITVETRHGNANDITVEIDNQSVKLDDLAHGTVIIENPKLWWARGYGEQNLYDINASVFYNGEIIDTKAQKIGLRTINVSTEFDEIGREFCFVLNGVRIFAMGANYVPQDNILSRINPDRTENLIKSAIDANFNCIRIWGGGYYPEDEFYDLCDKYGIIVWQDFMIACANIWLNKQMKNELIEEATYNVKRLRHHASLGIFCGNNEMEQAVEWGIADSKLVRDDYIELYERIFPEICDEYAPQTFYWQGSPSSGGGFDNPNDPLRGDVHYWAVWHSLKPFTEYRKYKFRFCSEYGFQSYPCMKTIKSFCDEDNMNCFSRLMENHQKNVGGNGRILGYLANNYLYPNSFEKLVYASQLLQADAIKYGVEHFRRCRGICMGSLYWQFNDCWPVASWSSIDYYGRYKALHYAARKFYAPISMGLFYENGVLNVNISNETMSPFEGYVNVYLLNSRLEVITSASHEVSVTSLKSDDAYTMNIDSSNKYDEFICAELYDKDGNFIMKQTELFVEPKHFEWKKPEISCTFTDCENGVLIEISSDVFAKGIYVDFDGYDCKLSDNFFDITDKTKHRIIAETTHTAAELRASAKILTVYDIGK